MSWHFVISMAMMLAGAAAGWHAIYRADDLQFTDGGFILVALEAFLALALIVAGVGYGRFF